jgi:uncharacterized protein YijF (DUF1287 family)
MSQGRHMALMPRGLRHHRLRRLLRWAMAHGALNARVASITIYPGHVDLVGWRLKEGRPYIDQASGEVARWVSSRRLRRFP